MNRGLAAIAVITVLLVVFFAERSCQGERIMRLSDRKVIDFGEMIAEIRGSRLIFIGEDHDSMKDHWRQLKVIKALSDSGTPLTIGLEMFTAESQGALDRWVAGKIDEATFTGYYMNNWDMPWYLYRDIFYFARRHGIPLIGLNVPRQVVHKVAAEGFAALSPAERRKLPTGVTCTVNSSYMSMIRRVFAEHIGNHDSFVHFCEAQMLWNKSMAWHLADYSRVHAARTVVVLAGSGHAMKPGIPGEVAGETGIGYRVILPEDDAFNRDAVTTADADYLMER